MRRIAVRTSPVHGRGVFALAPIKAGEQIIEYKGEVVSWKEAQRRHHRSAVADGHTFLFDLDHEQGYRRYAGRQLSTVDHHSCEPNAQAEQDGRHVFIHALRDVNPGEEIFIDYQLCVEGRKTAVLERRYACRCGNSQCRGTMLASSR